MRIFLLRLLIGWWMIPIIVVTALPLAWLLLGWSDAKSCTVEFVHFLWYGAEEDEFLTATKKEREAQRQSFAYGNTNLHNPSITREVVAEAARELEEEEKEA